MLLTSAQQSLDDTRLLLGKATSCVGREQELSTLDIVLNTCIDESSAAGLGHRSRRLWQVTTAPRVSASHRQPRTGSTVIYGRAEMVSKGARLLRC